MSGTELAYAATKCCTMSGTELAYAAGRCTLCSAPSDRVHLSQLAGTVLCACYAMSGTDLAYAAAMLYAMSGTGLVCCYLVACDATMWYAVSGTDFAYAATRPSDPTPYRGSYCAGTNSLSAYARSMQCPAICCYAIPTRCPVLTCAGCAVLIKAIVLRITYAIYGTEIGYGATRRRVSGREPLWSLLRM
eukprot:296041-Rhodomonas_salina.1